MLAWWVSTAIVMWGMIGLWGFVHWNFSMGRRIPLWNMIASFFISIVLGPIGWIISIFTGVNKKEH